MYEVYKVDRLWESRVTEGRNMAAKQMECVGAQIARLAKNSKGGFLFDVALENNIKSALNENKIAASSVLVCSERGSKKIDITLQAEGDTDKIEKIINSCTGEEYKMLLRVGSKLRFFRQEGMHISVGKMCQSKDDNAYNGDTASWEHLENGRFLMMLSDGMGSGERASEDSRATVEIAKRLLRCGFDAESAISIINSVLVLKSAETSFATVDMGLIDLKKREMEFYKLGAAQSFIKRGNEVKTITSESLPAGVFGDTDAEPVRVKLADGDTVIMVSDGIIGTDNENPLKEAIASYDGTNPQDMATMIINFARKVHADIISDDMTVVVATLNEEEAS